MSPRPETPEALGLLGIARRAGAVLRGVDATRRGLVADEVLLVLLARDASPTQLTKVQGVLRHRDVPVRWVSGREALGRALGEGPLAAAGVTGRTFAERLAERLPEGSPDEPGGWTLREEQEERGTDAGR